MFSRLTPQAVSAPVLNANKMKKPKFHLRARTAKYEGRDDEFTFQMKRSDICPMFGKL